MTTQAETQLRTTADALEAIARKRRRRDDHWARAQSALGELIAEAREAGATWAMIAEAMGGLTVNGVRDFHRRHGG